MTNLIYPVNATESDAYNLQIIRGYLNSTAGIISGEGFKASMDPEPGRRPGVYHITFNKRFATIPSVFAQVIFAGEQGGGSTRDNATVYVLTREGVDVVTGDANGNLANKFFTFMAVGVPLNP